MRIVVTGASGNVGTSVVRARAADDRVVPRIPRLVFKTSSGPTAGAVRALARLTWPAAWAPNPG